MRSWHGPDSSGFETVSVLYCKDNRKIKNNSKQGNGITFFFFKKKDSFDFNGENELKKLRSA